jgi:hypothetical protein
MCKTGSDWSESKEKLLEKPVQPYCFLAGEKVSLKVHSGDTMPKLKCICDSLISVSVTKCFHRQSRDEQIREKNLPANRKKGDLLDLLPSVSPHKSDIF